MTVLPYLLLGVITVLAVAQVAVVWRVLRDDAVRREQEHTFLWGVIERMRAADAEEVARADAVREHTRAQVEMVTAAQVAQSDSLAAQYRQGWATEMAEGRAAMVDAGFDPDDPEEVMAWNARMGAPS